MEKIGDYSENPFEGTYNDVPITSIARTIEIDMREMLGDSDIPKPIEAENGFLMWQVWFEYEQVIDCTIAWKIHPIRYP